MMLEVGGLAMTRIAAVSATIISRISVYISKFRHSFLCQVWNLPQLQQETPILQVKKPSAWEHLRVW
jgi:hypothetical protein